MRRCIAYRRVPITSRVVVQPDVTRFVSETPLPVIDATLREYQLTPDDLFYDLGCGNGRVVIRAVQLYGCQAVGIDINKDQARQAQRAVKAAGLESRVRIYVDDIRTCDVSRATAAYCYLDPSTLAAVVPRLSPGCRVASYSHPLCQHNHRVVIDGQSVYFLIPQE